MATKSLTVPERETAAHPCPCGCAPCEGTCCHLDCLVRPRFFCGQLLTDQDLSALVTWARDRFALSRYRDGWGVVCGLDVRLDPKHPARVRVTPGYAVGCCGDDIVVCEEAWLDLSDACREEKDPCADLRRLVGADAARAQRDSEGAKRVSDVAEGGKDFPGRWRAVDIFLRYAETPDGAATALGRSSCKEVAACEHSRTRESYKLTWELGIPDRDPATAAAVRWQEGYEKCLEVLLRFRQAFPGRYDGAQVRRWLLNWIERHPLQQFSLVREHICATPDERLGVERELVPILFYLVQDCRNAYLNCGCFSCDGEEGVPLGRVWIGVREGEGRDSCRVLWTDSYPPFRRPIGPGCWPAPPGYVNVGRAVWHRADEACVTLDAMGVHARAVTVDMPATLADLERLLRCDLFVKCGEERAALLMPGPEGLLFGEGKNEHLRVIGFCPDVMQEEEPRPCPTVSVRAMSKAVVVGEPVVFTVDVSGGETNVKPTYNWQVTNGAIVAGHGTPQITVTSRAVGQVLARIEVGGYDKRCDTTGSATATIIARRLPQDTAKPIERNPADEAVPVDREAAAVASPAADEPAAGESAAVAAGAEPDDFTTIKNFGTTRAQKAARAKKLAEAVPPIRTFADLAAAPVPRLQKLFPELKEALLTQWREDAKAKAS